MTKGKLLRLGLLFVVLTLFAWYFLSNQEQFVRIWELSLWQVALIVLGQSIVILSNIILLMILVTFLGKRMPFLQSARVTAYSSLINFFGFLQGGLGFRGIYLKRYYGMTLKRYTALTSLQYLVFFSIAGLLLITGLSSVLQIGQVIAIGFLGLITLVTVLLVINRFKPEIFTGLINRFKLATHFIKVRPIVAIALATILQLSGSMLTNTVALSGIGADITIGGLFIYTGISQFSIIIAVTPGAIGIRETILLLVQDQMGLRTSDIVVAATVDRLVYFITLAIFAPLAMSVRNNKVAEDTKDI